MAEKRRDNKGRVLRAGESQRPDGNCNFEECESVSWNEYIGVSESLVVEQTENDDHKKNNPTMGLVYTPKAKKKKQLNLDIATKSESDIPEAK